MVEETSYADVVIVGAGPAGHMLAANLVRMGIQPRIIDKRTENRFIGQADGLQSRTLETFQSMGFGDRALKESNHMLELCFWEPGEKGIVRTEVIPDSVPGISPFQQTVLHQGRVETWFQENIRKYSDGKVKIERPVQATKIDVDTNVSERDTNAYPITLTVDHLDEAQGKVESFGSKIASGLFRQFDGDGNKENAGRKEVIRAKYVVGCDGAHSWVRREMNNNVVMEGESTDYIWGVLDGIPITDFPDIRNRCAIHSEYGSVMIIPREHQLVRLYIQLEDIVRNETSGRVDRSKITPELILQSANKIFAPYTLDMQTIKWFTAYQIGQRVSTKFEDSTRRVFIAGDACHTHSPKAGQGMNVSMMDTYNLGWKLAHVLKGLADPKILLSSYEKERRPIAQSLINLDYRLSRLFSAKPGEVSLEEFHRVFERSNQFTSGCTVDYCGSELVEKDNDKYPINVDPLAGKDSIFYKEDLASHVAIGQRLISVQLVTQSDSKPIQTVDLLASDGRWRVLCFSGDFKTHASLETKLKDVAGYLGRKSNFVKKYTPASAREHSVFDVHLIHACDRQAVPWNEFPQEFRPRDLEKRMDYWRIYVDGESYHKGHGHAYETYGIDTSKGAIVVVRPDGYVATVQPFSLPGMEEVEAFFGKFMVPLKESWANAEPYIPKDKEEKEFYGVADVGEPILAL